MKVTLEPRGARPARFDIVLSEPFRGIPAGPVGQIYALDENGAANPGRVAFAEGLAKMLEFGIKRTLGEV